MTDKQLRWYTGLRSAPQERSFVAFDIEGRGGPDGFVSGATWGDDGPAFFYDRRAMWDFLLSPEHGDAWRTAHNLEYDLAVLNLDALFEEGALMGPGGLLWYDAEDHDGHPIRFTCSTKLFPGYSLAAVAHMVGLEKLKMGEEMLSLLVRAVPLSAWPSDLARDLEAYNIRDAEIVYRALVDLQEMTNALGGQLRETLASTSHDIYRRAYMPHGWKIVGPATNKHARGAFYGGRVEPFVMGKVRGVNLYDANSLYPQQQADLKFPDPNALDLWTRSSLPTDLENYEGVARVGVRVPKSPLPPLPARVGGALYFPYGEWTATYCLNELRHALSLGCQVTAFEWAILTKKTFNPFAEFVHDLYARRLDFQADDDNRQHLVKLLLNANIGRYGVRQDTALSTLERVNGRADLADAGGLVWSHLGNLDYIERPLPRDHDAPYANVMFPAYVAAGSRVFLHRAMTALESGPLYCDTDSLMTYDTLPTGDGLGEWKPQMLDGQADLIGPKEYVAMDALEVLSARAKGIPKGQALEYLTLGWTRYERAVSIREALGRGLMPSEWVQVHKSRGDPTPKRPPVSMDSEALNLGLTAAWPLHDLLFWYGSQRGHLKSANDARPVPDFQ
ncbi:MAG: hypothetical protein GY767_14035 [Shimia sp.]|nr:hypothetical protein [Shimia sp.]